MFDCPFIASNFNLSFSMATDAKTAKFSTICLSSLLKSLLFLLTISTTPIKSPEPFNIGQANKDFVLKLFCSSNDLLKSFDE
ncbi:hypothetical protein TVAG_167970 [Trichomonas vaginalis G3]|uniref:Uncharacterized protein n=1 Tax=Trichomonas vaginalis (strain ATCC PRA-98 / G3) TaxID=412133 RepID=A2FS49_TRIV3|nr:hypothetical protein TVAGG3_0699300 [Trichomonas vaginalis G3]EAX92264.1 hypothetical protein TVAG_167970 [Trichomonas vaginalis G3]KAI5509129.1 hypothetical protein TVAGG3_0699300 [Trichomonas vaginalis G3]|eukprot:XP_001305194.1 hypothetical protein [Trichomonas vaginalis G3]